MMMTMLVVVAVVVTVVVVVVAEKSAREKSRLWIRERERRVVGEEHSRAYAMSEQQVFADIAYQYHDGRWG